MNENIRILHFADIHVGMENYGQIDPATGISSRVMDFLARLDDIIAFAAANEADLVIFAGDAFKSRSPNPTYQREFAARIRQLAGICPVVMVVGNHDMPVMTRKASTLDIFATLKVENVIVGDKPDVHHVETRRGPVQVAVVPYPMRQRMLAQNEETRGLGINETDAELREIVSDVIDELAESLEEGVPAVLAGHFAVQGARLGSEQGIMLGQDIAVLLSKLADPIWDYVALGHIHAHQDLNKGAHPAVVYPGSLERIDFGERRDVKGFCWVTLAGEDTTWEFIPVNARPFALIEVDVTEAEEPMPVIERAISRHDLRGAVVRVIIKAMPEQNNLIADRQIQALLGEASYIDSIQHDLQFTARARLGTQNPEELTHPELLELYFKYREFPAKRIAELLAYAQEKILSQEE